MKLATGNTSSHRDLNMSLMIRRIIKLGSISDRTMSKYTALLVTIGPSHSYEPVECYHPGYKTNTSRGDRQRLQEENLLLGEAVVLA